MFQSPGEQLGEGMIASQVFHYSLIHPAPKEPDIESQHWPPQPVGQFSAGQAAPSSG